MQVKSKITLPFVFFMAVFCASSSAQDSYLFKFYTEGSPNYTWAFGTSTDCDPIVGMSTRTKNFRSPSKVAIRGLESVFSNDLTSAVACEEKLRAFEREMDGGLFYAFQDDYIGAWPFHLRAPWASAFTQGIVLEFYMELSKKTGDPYYKDQADKIYLSYFVPIEKGGFSRFFGEEVIFEEYPVDQSIAVLNGDLIATIALYDYAIFSKKTESSRLAQRSINWLQSNIQRYVISHPDYPGPISAYSLAPSRLDLLFRFYLTNNDLDIFSIEMAGNGISRNISLGSDGDSDISREASLIVSPDMNWTAPYNEPQEKAERYRKVVQGLGSFNHAPFRVEVNSVGELDDLKEGGSLKITYRAEGSSDVQISDGKTFYKVGTLMPTNGSVVTLTFDIPKVALSSVTFPSELKYNALYFEHNQKLLEIVSEISESEVLKRYSDILKR